MLPVSKHFTIVVGVDLHVTTLPPFNPIHPYIGIVMDIADYIPFIGCSTFVNGVPRGVSDTSGMLGTKVHIPIASGPFAMQPVIGHESVNFFGGVNTYSEGRRLSPAGHMLMTCNDVGIPMSFVPGNGKKVKVKKKRLPLSLFAPTSMSIPIPTGPPVLVGGPYVPDLAGLFMNLAMSFGFGCLLKGAGKLAAKAKNLSKKASDLMSGITPKVKTPATPKPKVNTPAAPKPKPKAIKPEPPFKKNPKHNDAEFKRQLGNQEAAINNMTVKEWLKNRDDFKKRNRTDYNKKSKQARDDFRQKELKKRTEEYRKNNVNATKAEAEKAAKDSMKNEAALHNPDGIAGGKADVVTDMGGKGVNSSLGSQWDKGRANSIESQVNSQYGIPPNTIDNIPDNAMMNVDLSNFA